MRVNVRYICFYIGILPGKKEEEQCVETEDQAVSIRVLHIIVMVVILIYNS